MPLTPPEVAAIMMPSVECVGKMMSASGLAFLMGFYAGGTPGANGERTVFFIADWAAVGSNLMEAEDIAAGAGAEVCVLNGFFMPGRKLN